MKYQRINDSTSTFAKALGTIYLYIHIKWHSYLTDVITIYKDNKTNFFGNSFMHLTYSTNAFKDVLVWKD